MSFQTVWVLHEGPIDQLEVAYNTRDDPTQVLRLTLWQREKVYLTGLQAEQLAAALLGYADGDG